MIKTLIQIMSEEYEIRQVSNKTLAQTYYGRGRTKNELEGYTNFDKQIIYINNDLVLQRQGIVLVHEWMHVNGDQSGITDMWLDEEFIRSREHGVYNMLKNFPEGFLV